MESKGSISRSVLVPPSKPTPYDVLPLTHGSVMAGLNTLVSSHALVFHPETKSFPSVGLETRSAVDIIQAGLAEVLVPYYPLAGRIVENDSGWEVQCDGRGAVFVVTTMPDMVEPLYDNYPDMVHEQTLQSTPTLIQHPHTFTPIPIQRSHTLTPMLVNNQHSPTPTPVPIPIPLVEEEEELRDPPQEEKHEVVVVTPHAPPPPPSVIERRAPMPVLTVQVTDLGRHGLVLCVRVCQGVCDTSGLVHFLSGWAEMARGKPFVSVAPVWPHTLIPLSRRHPNTSDNNHRREHYNDEAYIRAPQPIMSSKGPARNIQVHFPSLGQGARHGHVQTGPYASTNDESPKQARHHHPYANDELFGKARHLYTNGFSYGNESSPSVSDDPFGKAHHPYTNGYALGKQDSPYANDDALRSTNHVHINDNEFGRAHYPTGASGFNGHVPVYLGPTSRPLQEETQHHVGHDTEQRPYTKQLDDVLVPSHLPNALVATTQNILRLDLPFGLLTSLVQHLSIIEGIKSSATHALAAHVWRERTRALHIPLDIEARLFFVCDMDKNSPMGYHGAFKYNCVAKANVAKLLEMPLAWAVERVKAAERELENGNFIKCTEEFKRVHGNAEVLLFTELPQSNDLDQRLDFGTPIGKPRFPQDLLHFPPEVNIAAVAQPNPPNPTFLHIYFSNVPFVHADDLRSFISYPSFSVDTPSRM